MSQDTSEEIRIGLDSAASSFYLDGGYSVDGNRLSPGELIDLLRGSGHDLSHRLLEDPFEEEAYDDFARLTAKLPGTIIIGDDLYVTNIKRLEKGIKMRATNALLLKLNQIGSVSEAFDAAQHGLPLWLEGHGLATALQRRRTRLWQMWLWLWAASCSRPARRPARRERPSTTSS